MRAKTSNPAKGSIIVAPTKKKPIPKVRQISDRNPKKTKFSFRDEELFGVRFIYKELPLISVLNIKMQDRAITRTKIRC